MREAGCVRRTRLNAWTTKTRNGNVSCEDENEMEQLHEGRGQERQNDTGRRMNKRMTERRTRGKREKDETDSHVSLFTPLIMK